MHLTWCLSNDILLKYQKAWKCFYLLVYFAFSVTSRNTRGTNNKGRDIICDTVVEKNFSNRTNYCYIKVENWLRDRKRERGGERNGLFKPPCHKTACRNRWDCERLIPTV